MKTAKSHAALPQAAVAELRDQLGADPLSLIVYFHSTSYDAQALASAVQAEFKDVQTLGCSTSGELVSGAMLDNAVVAMGFPVSLVPNAYLGLVGQLSADPKAAAEVLLADVFGQAGTTPATIDITRYAGLVLIDGLSGAEENLVSRIGELTDMSVVGGSAGDDLKFKQTFVAVNGVAQSNAAAFAILEVPAGFSVIKTQSFDCTDKVLTATKVDAGTREVLEFNGCPAVAAYCAAVGATSPEDGAGKFMSNPVGLVDAAGNPYVRSPMQFHDSAMKFYCGVNEGADLVLLESKDIVEDTRKDLEATLAAQPVAALLNFHCILRTLELKARGQTDAYGQLFAAVPMVGFSTYGEVYIGHINQTSTMLALHA